jgi:hypothetical protein
MADGFDDVYVDTRRQLRGVAESFIAGPQHRASGTIRLAVRSDSFTGVSIPIAVHGTDLVFPTGSVTLVGPLSAIAAEAARVDLPQPLRRWACTETSSDREPHPTVRGVSPPQAL